MPNKTMQVFGERWDGLWLWHLSNPEGGVFFCRGQASKTFVARDLQGPDHWTGPTMVLSGSGAAGKWCLSCPPENPDTALTIMGYRSHVRILPDICKYASTQVCKYNWNPIGQWLECHLCRSKLWYFKPLFEHKRDHAALWLQEVNKEFGQYW